MLSGLQRVLYTQDRIVVLDPQTDPEMETCASPNLEFQRFLAVWTEMTETETLIKLTALGKLNSRASYKLAQLIIEPCVMLTGT